MDGFHNDMRILLLGRKWYWKNETYGIIPELKIEPVGKLDTVCGWPGSSLTHPIVVPVGMAICGG